jgi:hypothetical protein
MEKQAGYGVRVDGAFARSDRPEGPGDEADAAQAAPDVPDVPDAHVESDVRPVPQVASDRPVGPPRETVGRDRSPVLEPAVAQRLRDDWQQVQYDFVDDPHQAAERADAVVVRATRRVAEALLARNAEVRQRWQALGPGSAARDTGTSTEQLRVVLQQYREVLNRVIEL